jgi:hypothetical protein
MKIIIVILAAAVIFLGIRIIRLGIKYLLKLKPGFNFPWKIIMVAEFMIWSIFVFRSTDFLFRGKFFYQYIIVSFIVIFLGLLTWFFIRDIFAGFIFRIKYSLKTGTYISAGNINGQIKSQQLTSIRLKTDDGLIHNIPYTRIIDEVITELGFRGTPEEHILQLQADVTLGRTKAEELIRTALLSTPWNNLKEEPIIRFLKENEKGYFFEIKLFSVRMKHIKLIEIALDNVPLLHIISQKQSSDPVIA